MRPDQEFAHLVYHYLCSTGALREYSSDIRAAFALIREKTGSELFNPSALSETVELKVNHSSLDSAADRALRNLARRYEETLCSQGRKKDGAFYTPIELVRFIVSKAFNGRELRGPDGRVTALDPACGSGLFLLEVLDRLIPKEAAFEQAAEIVESSIFGVDRDTNAAAAARLMLQLALLQHADSPLAEIKLPSLAQNIRAGNSLLDPSQLSQQGQLFPESHDVLSLFSWRENFPQIFERGGFDLIVGNPPYGLSRDEQISTAENELLKQIYSSIRSGKVNKYMVFMARGLELLNSRGALCFVVPNSWLGIRSAAALRRKIIGMRALESISVCLFKAFEDPSVEAVVVKLDKSRRHERIRIEHLYEPHMQQAAKFFELPAAECSGDPECKIALTWSPEVLEVLRAIASSSQKLSERIELFEPLIALQAYAAGKGTPPQSAEDVKRHIFDRNTKESALDIPYLEGSDIERFQVNWSGGYLHYGPWLAEPQNLDRFTGPRVVIREILASPPYLLRAAVVEDQFLYNKSVLHIVADRRGKTGLQEMQALCAILNSKLASFVILHKGRKSQRSLFPKIVNDDLLDLPLPSNFDRHAGQLAKLLARPGQIPDDELNTLVYECYRLKNSHVSTIEQSLASKKWHAAIAQNN